MDWRSHRPRQGRAGVRGLAALLVGCAAVPSRLSAQYSALAPVSAPVALAFRGVTVIDVTDGRRLVDQTVVVVGSRIQSVGPAKKVAVPTGAHVVEARGKYLLPGFWDMHAHAEADNVIPNPTAADEDAYHRQLYARYIAQGITGVRELAQRWGRGGEAADSFRAWQRQIRAGTLVGPRGVGPSTDVTFEWRKTDLSAELTNTTADDARRIIDSIKAAGDAFAKMHNYPQGRDVFFALLREARRVGLPVVGHVPDSITNVEAADSGLYSIEHSFLNQHCGIQPDSGPLPDSAAFEAACAPAAQAYLRNGTWVTPTLAYHWLWSDGRDVPAARSSETWAATLRMWRTLHRLGVRTFLAGTDCPYQQELFGPQVWAPGLSAREEMVLLADAGLTPLEALQAATLNPARFFEATDSLGTVAAGKLADVVLLDADPLADITNVLQLWGVVANGRYFDHAALVRMDPVGFTPGAGIVAADRRLRQPTSGAGPTGRPAP